MVTNNVVIKQISYAIVQITDVSERAIIFDANDLDFNNLPSNVTIIDPLTVIETTPVQYTDLNGNIINPLLV